jgi:hypothetical protein
MPDKPNGFDVMKEISRRNGPIFMVPIGNILRMNKVKAGAQLTIGVPFEIMMGLVQDKYLGGLYVCDREEFARVEAELKGSDA